MGNTPPLKRIGTLSGKGFGAVASRRGDVVRDTYLPLNSTLELFAWATPKTATTRNPEAGSAEEGLGVLVEAFW